jgi:hypothetical protein
VDAARALAELGVVNVPADRAVSTLRQLLPPAGDREDARVQALKKGIAVPRSDFDLVYSVMAARLRAGQRGTK